MQAAWRRQWLPRCQRQLNLYNVTGSLAVAGTRSTCRPIAPYQRCWFGIAAAGGQDGAGGNGGTSPPKPRASSMYGNRRQSDRLRHKNETLQWPDADDGTMQIKRLPSFNMDNLRALESSMDNGNPNHPRPTPRSKRSSSKPPRWSKYHHLPKSSVYNDPGKDKRIAAIKKSRTIDEAVQVAYDNLGALSPDETELFWKKFSSLLGKPSKSKHGGDNDDGRMIHHLDAIYQHTMNGMDQYNPLQLSNVAQASASIVKTLTSRGGRPNHKQTMLYNLFVKDSTPFWDCLQDLALTLIDSFRPKWLVSIAWSFATIYHPIVRGGNLDVSPFFHAFHKTFRKRKNEFTSKHLGNLAWSCMTCRQDMPMLFNEFSEQFINRRKQGMTQKDDGIDPMTLSQWATTFAKAGHRDKALFQSISDAAIPLLSEFDARNFSNVAHAFAVAEVVPHLDKRSSSLLDEIAAAAIPQISTFSPQNIANTLWAYAKMEHNSPNFFHAVANESSPRLKEFSAQHLANCAWALSKFPSSSYNAFFDLIAEEVVARGMDKFTPQGLSMLSFSFATVGHVKSTEFWDTIENATTSRERELGAIECSQIAWSFATIERPSSELFHSIESVAIQNMDNMTPQGLANLAWAFSTLGYGSQAFFYAISHQSIQRLGQFNQQDIIVLVLALSKIDQRFPELLDQIATTSISHLDKFMPLDLFNMVVSYAKAGHRSEKLMKVFAEAMVRRPSEFSPQMIVGIVWAYAFLVYRMPGLLDFLADECITHCASLEAKEVASLAWSFASLKYIHRPFLRALADSADGRWQDFDENSLSNMAWAYATAQEDQPQLFEGIVEAAIGRKSEFSAQSVSMLLWACSAAGHLDQRLFHSFAPTIVNLLHDCNGQALVNIAWAYTVANVDAQPLFGPQSPFFDALADKFEDIDYEGLCQLHQWNVWQKSKGSDAALPPLFGKSCFDEFTNQPLTVSKLQKDVISELTLMGFSLQEEFQTQSGYYLDALVDVNGKQMGVEVDGPHHFIGGKPTGSTILKTRQVTTVDKIPIVSLPYWEWNGLGSSSEKQQYLQAKLMAEK